MCSPSLIGVCNSFNDCWVSIQQGHVVRQQVTGLLGQCDVDQAPESSRILTCRRTWPWNTGAVSGQQPFCSQHAEGQAGNQITMLHHGKGCAAETVGRFGIVLIFPHPHMDQQAFHDQKERCDHKKLRIAAWQSKPQRSKGVAFSASSTSKDNTGWAHRVPLPCSERVKAQQWKDLGKLSLLPSTTKPSIYTFFEKIVFILRAWL